ncbi:hypothetical protein VP01_4409g1, partial [Puccinia sorghi]
MDTLRNPIFFSPGVTSSEYTSHLPLPGGLSPRGPAGSHAFTLLGVSEKLPQESHFHRDGNRRLLDESRKVPRKASKTLWPRQGKEPHQSNESSSPFPSIDSAPSIPHHPILYDLSNPSQKVHLLNHINHDLENTAPCLIEEKLQHLFSNLAKAMNEFPNAISNSEFVNEKFENTQNIFLVNEAQNQSELENLKSKISLLENLVVKKLNSTNYLINGLNLNERNSRTTPPHIIHNNALMNNSVIAPSYSPAPENNLSEMTEEEKIRPHIPVNKKTHPPTSYDSFTFINHAGILYAINNNNNLIKSCYMLLLSWSDSQFKSANDIQNNLINLDNGIQSLFNGSQRLGFQGLTIFPDEGWLSRDFRRFGYFCNHTDNNFCWGFNKQT